MLLNETISNFSFGKVPFTIRKTLPEREFD